MEAPAEAAAAASFSQVVFTDIPHSYPPSTPVSCCYTLCRSLQPSSRDWVGIFKVGWSSTKDYHTFVWVEQTPGVVGQHAIARQAVFKEYYLPRDDVEFYQFCYVDGGGQVRGASTPFCFRAPDQPGAEGGADDDDLLVITTQEQVEQSVREKAELQSELDRLSAENQSLKSALRREQQQSRVLQEDSEKRDGEMSEVVKELHQSREEVKTLQGAVQQQRQENQRLQEEVLLQQRTESQQKQQSQSLATDDSSRQKEQGKYERAVMKINQQKEELGVLRATVDVQSEEIATLSAKVREGERELSKSRDSVQLLQVDLQSSEKDKDKLTAELRKLQSLVQIVDELKQRNQQLSSRLAEAETETGAGQSFSDDGLKDRCQTLVRQLDDARARLDAERDKTRSVQRKSDFLENELQQLSEQLEKVMKLFEEEQQKSSKLELQLREMMNVMAEKDILMQEKESIMELEKREKEELFRENETLKRDNQGLRQSFADFHRIRSDAGAAAQNIPSMPQQSPGGQADNLYESIRSVEELQEESLVCVLCQESFPGITADELELHKQTHRVCPFCSVVCDAMGQAEFEDHVYGHEL